MAEVVAAFSASHAPMMTAARDSAPEEQRDSFFGGLEKACQILREKDPQAVVICSNEHYTNFFLQNFPQFCIGLGERHLGPVEQWLKIDRGWVPGSPELAEEVVTGLLREGFDPSFSHELRLDHGVMTIYHAIDHRMELPLIPIIQNCAVKPLPTLRRCYEFGKGLRAAIEKADAVDRVAVVGAGGLSHFVGVPRVGDIDPAFDRWFLDRLTRGDLDDVLSMPDEELEMAGNGAHEIRSWLTIAGVAEPVTAEVLAYEPIDPWITGMGVVSYDLARVPTG